MKRLFAFTLTVLFCAALTAAAPAKSTAPKMMSAVSMNNVSDWLGTWNCVSGKSKYTIVFAPLLGGSAMSVSAPKRPNPAEGIAKFDKAQNKWFYTAVFGNGMYLSLMGAQSGSTINFKEVFPPAGATLVVMRPSKTKYSDTFTGMVNGKKTSLAEVCTR